MFNKDEFKIARMHQLLTNFLFNKRSKMFDAQLKKEKLTNFEKRPCIFLGNAFTHTDIQRLSLSRKTHYVIAGDKAAYRLFEQFGIVADYIVFCSPYYPITGTYTNNTGIWRTLQDNASIIFLETASMYPWMRDEELPTFTNGTALKNNAFWSEVRKSEIERGMKLNFCLRDEIRNERRKRKRLIGPSQYISTTNTMIAIFLEIFHITEGILLGSPYFWREEDKTIDLNTILTITHENETVFTTLNYGLARHHLQMYIMPKMQLEWEDQLPGFDFVKAMNTFWMQHMQK